MDSCLKEENKNKKEKNSRKKKEIFSKSLKDRYKIWNQGSMVRKRPSKWWRSTRSIVLLARIIHEFPSNHMHLKKTMHGSDCWESLYTCVPSMAWNVCAIDNSPWHESSLSTKRRISKVVKVQHDFRFFLLLMRALISYHTFWNRRCDRKRDVFHKELLPRSQSSISNYFGNVHGRLNASWKICSLAVNGQSFLVIDGYL